MIHRAYGYARLSAQRSDLLTSDDVAAMRFTSDEISSARAVRALGIETESKRFERLSNRYRTILRCYPEAAALVRALLGLHEIENVKLGWRAVSGRIDADRWIPLWCDLKDLAAVPLEPFVKAHTLYDVVERLAKTPYADIASDVYAAHSADLGSAELAFDQWASRRVLAAAGALSGTESLAREIATELIYLRDEQIERRGVAAYGLSAEAASALRVLPRRRSSSRLPLLCRRAFRGQVARLAPPIAYAVLAERDYRIARALSERGGNSELDAAADRAIGGSG